MKIIDINPLFLELSSKEATAISGGASGHMIACFLAPCPQAEPDLEELLRSNIQKWGKGSGGYEVNRV
jgi:hypothetical protein